MYNIKYVAQSTGLSPHTIRAWERRYTALSPDRTATNRRLYTLEDIEKLRLLAQAIEAGHSIGRIAHLSPEELRRTLPKEPAALQSPSSFAHEGLETSVTPFLEQSLRAIDEMDVLAFTDTLTRASAVLGTSVLIDYLLVALLQKIGEYWRSGRMRIVQEHMASAVIRTFLGRTLATLQPSSMAPRLVVTTPKGQIHELGALMVATSAALQGWRVLYLGPNLPATEIAGALHRYGAKVVALSIVYPPDDPHLQVEIELLRQLVGDDVSILVGGQSACAYQKALQRIEATLLSDMSALHSELDRVRLL